MSATPADPISAVRDLVAAIPATAPGEVATRAEALRAQIEEALFGGADPEAMGLLNDAVVSLILYARAAQSGDADRAQECLEQARLFLAATGDGND
jgi:hypothetical protein